MVSATCRHKVCSQFRDSIGERVSLTDRAKIKNYVLPCVTNAPPRVMYVHLCRLLDWGKLPPVVPGLQSRVAAAIA